MAILWIIFAVLLVGGFLLYQYKERTKPVDPNINPNGPVNSGTVYNNPTDPTDPKNPKPKTPAP